MKLISIMVMALLLAGIGSAQNYLPESVMEPGADLSMFSGDPGNVEMWGGDINNATYINTTYLIDSMSSGVGVTVGKTPDCDFSTIQSAIDYAADNGGRVIFIQNGTYEENITFYADNTWLVGEGSATIINSSVSPAISIDDQDDDVNSGVADSGMRNLVVCANGNVDQGVYIGNTEVGSYLILDNLRVFGFDESVHIGTNTGAVNRSTYAFTIIQNSILGDFASTNLSTGIHIEYAIETTIQNCKIQGYNTTGIYIEHGDSIYIDKCNIISMSGSYGDCKPSYGIAVDATGENDRCVDLKITRNAIESSNVTHIYLKGNVFGVDISDNWFGIGAGDIRIQGSSADPIGYISIDGNIMYDKGESGYDNTGNIKILNKVDGVSVTNNQIEVGLYGVWSNGFDGRGDGLSICGNTFRHSGIYANPVAIRLVTCNNTRITGNNFDEDISWGSGYAVYAHSDTFNTHIDDVTYLTPISVAGTRITVNGIGRNSGDPSSTGDWNGYGYEGLRVIDTTTNNIYVYANGGWVAL